VALCVAVTSGQTSLRERIIAAENARVATDAGIAPILEGLRSGDATTVAVAARALGRFEQPAFVQHLIPLLVHARIEVRREAANAAGQSVAALPRAPDATPSRELDTVLRALLERLDVESDPYVRGTIAETLGRLPYRSAETVRQVELALQRHLADVQTTAGTQPLHPGSLIGVVTGVEALVRANRSIHRPDAVTVARVRALAVSTLFRLDEAFIQIRRLAWRGVIASGAADADLIQRGVADPDFQVRRLAVAALAGAGLSGEQRRALLATAMDDRSFHVRYEAVAAYGRLLKGSDCAPLIRAARDSNTHVVLAAIDALGNGCAAESDSASVLTAFIDRFLDADTESGAKPPIAWHAPAHALVALAGIDRDDAGRRLPRSAAHPIWQVRAYAARAATALGTTALLERMIRDDESDNVRYEALLGLKQLQGHAADPLFIASLARSDYQLVLAAADALEGSPDAKSAVPALLAAFARLTKEGRETSRDPRVAILRRLRELGAAEDAGALASCLRDFDPVVAAECAATLERWTGSAHVPRPTPGRGESIDGTLPLYARVVMRGGGAFDLALLTEDAPASVSRFARLASREYYDGLTFHRVLPNFVIQGGSPGANEYAGDGPFMRDELGLRSNRRGTVGVSTRGRDTGDAQFFINLLDNPRLDHEYTVFAEITSGMDVVDAILEGDVIERIELR
jgi:cyclophilin family peptidyl-prolyl cis-trans isomerase/HEAT repeat protein